MRRRLLVLLALPRHARCLAAGGARAGTAPTATAADIAPLAAVQADSLVDSYGVGIHLAFLDTPYKDATAVANALSDLGVRHVRDDLLINDPRQYAGIKTVADRGIKFNLIMGNPSSPDSAAAYVDTVATQLPAGSVESLEGSNEWDLFSGGDPPVGGQPADTAARALRGGQGQPRDREPAGAGSGAGVQVELRHRRRPLAVRRHRQRPHVPRRLQALQRGHPDHHGDPRVDPGHQAADHDRGRLPQRAEHDQRPPAGAGGRGRGLHAPGAARALPARREARSTPTS